MHRDAAERDLDDEVQHYLEEATAALVAQRPVTATTARRAARHAVGACHHAQEQVRDDGWENTIGGCLADVRFAGRMLRKSPVFTLVVVLVISIGSGAVTTIFSAMNALVLRPLPGVTDPAASSASSRFAPLVKFYSRGPTGSTNTCAIARTRSTASPRGAK